MSIDILQENDKAFSDVDAFILKYIPSAFKGLIAFKFNYEYNEKSISINFNAPVRLFFAIDPKLTSVFDNTWRMTDYEMSIFKIADSDIEKMKSGIEVVAEDEINLIIYYKDFQPGNIKVDTNVTKPIQIIGFIAPNKAPLPDLCSGSEVDLLSEKNG